MAQGKAEKHLILGTAGHVDHGKTTLITALTGTNPDRLREEQERGMTIDLGFAHIRLPSGVQMGIVDVPGHERFLKNMLAGAGGIDLALLVIAADEGVMPQTREHLEILEILETKQGVVALTKADLVEPDWAAMVEEDVRQFLKGTFLGGAPVIRVSAHTGEGLEELIRALDEAAQRTAQRPVDGPFRMPVDRVFTITGFGTVATGSLVSGTVRAGDPVEVLPQMKHARARQIQVHGRKVEEAVAGTRVAVNLAGVDVEDLARGSVLSPPGVMRAAEALDASLRVLSSSPAPVRNRLRVRLHIGSAEAIGRAYVLGGEEIPAGASGFVQVRLESPAAAARGDRFVLRMYSPACLLGGGVVLDSSPSRHRRTDKAVTDRLQRILDGDPVCVVEDALASAPAGLAAADVARVTHLPETEAARALKELQESGRAVIGSGRAASRAAIAASSARIAAVLEAYHQANPTRQGMPREELRRRLGAQMDQKGFAFLLGLMADAGQIVQSEAVVRLAGHAPSLSPEQRKIAEAIEQDYISGGVNPPLLQETFARHGPAARDILPLLAEQGKLARINEEILFHPGALADAERALRGYLAQNGEITVAGFRDLIGSSRKYAVPLLEYFDSKGVTRRHGDVRRLRE